ncbi:hypothetical protein BGZ80_006220, partial [Entomortierella chlamydospora]
MSMYICRQCALQRGSFKAATIRIQKNLVNGTLPQPRRSVPSRFQSSLSPNKPPLIKKESATEAAADLAKVASSHPRARQSRRKTSQPPKSANPTPSVPYATSKLRGLHIKETRERIDLLISRLEIDQLYLEFWKICCTESLLDQRGIWRSPFKDDSRLESFYRAFNSPVPPKHSTYPNDPDQGDSQIPPSRVIIQYNDSLRKKFTLPALASSTTSASASSPPSASTPLPLQSPSRLEKSSIESLKDEKEEVLNYHLNFIGTSHAKRLLQIHHYLEQVLGLRIGYYPRVALVVALASRGDMITVQKIFQRWQQFSFQHQNPNKGTQGPETGGKEMYSAVIRGLVGRNFHDPERLLYFKTKDYATGIRSRGITQMYAALELFYDLVRRGGTPTFETYHSLVTGLACFKNDIEAAELLLDHMIMMKKKPYAPVLHIMCREYARRKDFKAAERIFGMLKEYNVPTKAITCNVMLRAVFQMSTVDALQYLSQSADSDDSKGSSNDSPRLDSEDLDARARHLKRQKIKQLREYMRENQVSPDEATFSTLFYGYGHLEDGYPDLKAVMSEMAQQQSPKIESNMVILNSLLFAHLNHGKVNTAESILDQILQSTHPVHDSTEWLESHQRLGWRKQRLQSSSPFRRSQEEEEEDDGEEEATGDREFESLSNEDTVATTPDAPEPNNERKEDTPRPVLMVPGKGVFHALMLGYIDKGDITGMERVLDKMIQANQQQQQIQLLRASKYRITGPFVPLVDLKADEYTANIMLLGYLTLRDFDKADNILNLIRSRPDWASNS